MMRKAISLTFLFLIFFSCTSSFSNSSKEILKNSKDTEQTTEFKFHLDSGDKYFSDLKYYEAIESYTKAKSIAIQSRRPKEIILTHSRIGEVYMEISSFDKALEHFLLAHELSNNKYPNLRAKIELNLGILLEQTAEFSSALNYLLKSASYFESDTGKYDELIQTYSSIGIVYGRNNAPDSALVYFRKGLKLANSYGNTTDSGALLNNIGAIYFKQNQFEEAQEYYTQSLNLFNTIKLKKGIAIAKMNLGQIDMAIGNYKNAEQNLTESLTHFEESGSLFHLKEAYLNLSDLYSETNNYKKAFEYHQLYTEINDSLNKQETLSITNTIETQNLIESKNQEIKLAQKENELKSLHKKLLSFIILGVLIIGVIVFFYQKAAIRNSKLSNMVLEKEQLLLKQDLDFKRNELENFALHIVQKNEFISEIKSELKSINNNASEKNKEKIKALNLKVNQYLRINRKEQDLAKHINNVNDSFFSHLKATFPQLTKKELNLCALLKLNLSSKEISVLNNVTERAVIMARYRLRKKLCIPKEMGVVEFLDQSEQQNN